MYSIYSTYYYCYNIFNKAMIIYYTISCIYLVEYLIHSNSHVIIENCVI